jgi:hypothetical protein
VRGIRSPRGGWLRGAPARPAKAVNRKPLDFRLQPSRLVRSVLDFRIATRAFSGCVEKPRRGQGKAFFGGDGRADCSGHGKTKWAAQA